MAQRSQENCIRQFYFDKSPVFCLTEKPDFLEKSGFFAT